MTKARDLRADAVLSRDTRAAILFVMHGVGPKATASVTRSARPPRDRVIGELAASQHGAIALAQLTALGLTASAVRMRVASGRLRRIHRGVYAVGYVALTHRGRAMAAVLACGPGAVVSHRDAARLLGLLAGERATVDVAAPRRRGRSIAAITAHRADTLAAIDITSIDGIPCTTVARTLLDLAEVVTRRQLERACDQSEVLQLFDLRAVEGVLERANGRRGVAALRAVLAEHAPASTLTRSELEERFLRLCRAHALPEPEVNAWLPLQDGGGIEADFLWRAQRIVVETDGRDVHMTPRAFENDRRRDQRLLVAGWRVARFTARHITREPDRVVATIRALLSAELRPGGRRAGSGS